MAYRVPLVNFSKGEIAPLLYGRIDVAAYGSALARARNVMVQKYGGVTKRPGMRFVAEVLDATQPVRLVPFQFSIEQAYALEMGQGYMRPAALGGMVLEGELRITGISNEPFALIQAAYHGYSVGDQVYFTGIVGPDELNGRIATVTDAVRDGFRVNIDTSGMPAFVSASGGATNTAPPPPPEPDPVVPPPVPEPEPPPVGGGGGGGTRPRDPNEEIP